MNKLEFSGDFADFDCIMCFRRTRVTIKDELLTTYYCAYCGEEHRLTMELKTE